MVSISTSTNLATKTHVIFLFLEETCDIYIIIRYFKNIYVYFIKLCV